MHRDLYVPPDITKRCDNTSVGVIVGNPAGDILLFRRNTPPVGRAGPAGHQDDHGSLIDTAIAEVREETGLAIQTLYRTPIRRLWRDNVCCRQPGRAGFGHEWTIFRGVARGALNLAVREATDPEWASPRRLTQLAQRTVDRANNLITAEEFAADPGLEPVWVRFLDTLGYVNLRIRDLAAVECLAIASPYPQPAPRAAS